MTPGKETIVENLKSRRVVPMVLLLFMVGTVSLSRYSHGVRGVDVVGLSGAGFAIGVGFAFLVMSLTGKLKTT